MTSTPVSTGKQGTDIPPLVAEVKQGRVKHRFYALTPEVKADLEAGRLDVREALNHRLAFPSITTCLGALDKPALTMWAAGLAADHGQHTLRALAALAEAGDLDGIRDQLTHHLKVVDSRNDRTRFRREAVQAHTTHRDTAASRGTEVHAIAEQITLGATIDTLDIPDTLTGYAAAAQTFKDALPDAEYLYTEATVYNETAAVMGTTDFIMRIGGRTYVGDYKTNKDGRVYSTTGMQLAAAANADWIVFADGRREPMPHIDGGLGVGFGPDGQLGLFHFDVDDTSSNWRGFLGARRAWQWKFDCGDYSPRSISFERLRQGAL